MIIAASAIAQDILNAEDPVNPSILNGAGKMNTKGQSELQDGLTQDLSSSTSGSTLCWST